MPPEKLFLMDFGKALALWASKDIQGFHSTVQALVPPLELLVVNNPDELLTLLQRTVFTVDCDKNTTVFWVIARAAFEHHPAALNALLPFLEKLAKTQPDALLSLLQTKHQGQTVLWLISVASRCPQQHPAVLNALLSFLEELAETQPGALLSLMQAGPVQGQTVFWAIAVAGYFHHTHIDIFKALLPFLEKLAETQPDALLRLLQTEPIQGQTALWWIIAASWYQSDRLKVPEVFKALLLFLEKLAETQPDALLSLLQAAPEGQTVLWLMVTTVDGGVRLDALNALLPLLVKLSETQPNALLSLLRAAPAIGWGRGLTLFFMIMRLASFGYPAVLNALVPYLMNLESQQLLEMLNVEPMEQDHLLSSLFRIKEEEEPLERYHFLLTKLPSCAKYNEEIASFLSWALGFFHELSLGSSYDNKHRVALKNRLAEVEKKGYSDIYLFIANYLLELEYESKSLQVITREVLNFALQQEGADKNAELLFLHGHTFYIHAIEDEERFEKSEGLLAAAFLSFAKLRTISVEEKELEKAEKFLIQTFLTSCQVQATAEERAFLQKDIDEHLLNYFNEHPYLHQWSLEEARKSFFRKIARDEIPVTNKKQKLNENNPKISTFDFMAYQERLSSNSIFGRIKAKNREQISKKRSYDALDSESSTSVAATGSSAMGPFHAVRTV